MRDALLEASPSAEGGGNWTNNFLSACSAALRENKGLVSVVKQKIGFPSATVLVIANMIGTGIFTTSGFIIKELGNPQAMLLCWVVGGIFALSGALCYGELGAMFPRAGGEYAYLRESFGPGWRFFPVGFR